MKRELLAFFAAALAGLVVLMLVQNLPAGDSPTNDSDYFTFKDSEVVQRNGFWWKGEDAYARLLFRQSGTGSGYSNGYRTYWAYFKVPVIVKDKVVYQNAKVAYTADWKNEVLKALEQQNDQAAFLQALAALGANAPPAYPGNLSSYSSTTALQSGVYGDTRYGASLNSLAALYGDNNPSILYQQAARLTQNSQQLAGQATTDFKDLVALDQAGRERLARLAVVGQAMAEAFRATGTSQSETRTFTFQVGPNGAIQQVQPQPGDPTLDPTPLPPHAEDVGFRSLTQTRCGACHTGADPKGGFDVSTYSTLDPKAKRKVWMKLLDESPETRMPKGKPALSGAELGAFLAH